jgi:hypothetical protein
VLGTLFLSSHSNSTRHKNANNLFHGLQILNERERERERVLKGIPMIISIQNSLPFFAFAPIQEHVHVDVANFPLPTLYTRYNLIEKEWHERVVFFCLTWKKLFSILLFIQIQL